MKGEIFLHWNKIIKGKRNIKLFHNINYDKDYKKSHRYRRFRLNNRVKLIVCDAHNKSIKNRVETFILKAELRSRITNWISKGMDKAILPTYYVYTLKHSYRSLNTLNIDKQISKTDIKDKKPIVEEIRNHKNKNKKLINH